MAFSSLLSRDSTSVGAAGASQLAAARHAFRSIDEQLASWNAKYAPAAAAATNARRSAAVVDTTAEFSTFTRPDDQPSAALTATVGRLSEQLATESNKR